MLQYTLIVWLVLLLTTGVSTSVEADRGASRIEGAVPEDVREQENFDAAESAGLFVGVSNFKDQELAEIPYAVDDAVDLAHLFAVELALITPGRVTLALSGEPKKEESKDRLQALTDAGAKRQTAAQADIYEYLKASRNAAGERGLFVVAMATHGFTHNRQQYLAGSDSRFSFIEETGITAATVFNEVAKAQAPRRLVLLDACREELLRERAVRGVADPESAMGEAFANAITAARGQVVLFGTTEGGYSYDDADRRNGVFTGAILDGLRGAAPADENHFITPQTLTNYVHNEVSQWVQSKRPAHVDKSQGISYEMAGSMAHMPLAIDPGGMKEEKQERQRKALAKLGANLRGPITGSLYDLIKGALERPLPPDLWEQLLIEIEALDGSVRSQGYLVYWVNENRSRLSGEGVLPPEALRKLHDNKGDVITDTLYDRIVQGFEPPLPPDLREQLLIEIEALDGSVRSQRSLAYWVNEISGQQRVEPNPAPEAWPALEEVSLALERSERRLIQLGLTAEGFDAKPADGLFGRQTRAAIGKWQTARDKAPTGYLDAEAARLLLAAGQGEAETLALLQEAIRLYVSGSSHYPRARKLFEEAADSEHPLAVMWLARSYVAGRVGFPEDEERGRALARDVIAKIRDLARNGDREASFLLGSAHHRHGLAVAKDPGQAVSWYRQAAEQGHMVAQRNLGVMYETGSRGGVDQSDREAVKWYRAAAEQGYARAQNDLGTMYMKDNEDESDIEAVKWFRAAAEQGDARGQFNLGEMYREGRGVVQDYEEAAKWYREAAADGKADAQLHLGMMHMEGRGVEPSPSEAAKWYRKAAEQGTAKAQFNLGRMYMEGRGVDHQSDSEAAEWYRKAAEQGHRDAQFDLGRMYVEGRGVDQSDGEADEWIRRAANQGHEEAQRWLELGN